MQVLVFADKRFLGPARREVTAMGGRFMYRVSERSFLAEVADNAALPEKSVFIDGMAKVHSILSAKESNDHKIIELLQAMLSKDRVFRLEVVNDNLHSGENAKTTEVRIGRALEAAGFHADMKDAIDNVVIERTSATTIIGISDVRPWLANPFRNSNNKAKISRSAYKLEEAMSYFNIGKAAIRLALDIGSAPGGWALALSSFSKVVALDPAMLDYNSLKGKRVTVVTDDAQVARAVREACPSVHLEGTGPEVANTFDILHIMARVENSLRLLEKMNMKFDILAMDANLPVQDCARFANVLCALLNGGAPLILTIKLFRRNPIREAMSAERLLDGFTGFALKKLPHNRDEITLYATKKESRKTTQPSKA
jgi:CheY-like chemotaxis protein